MIRSATIRRRGILPVLAIIAAVATPVGMAALIGTYGVNVPFADDWPLSAGALQSRQHFDPGAAQHDEHRPVLLKLVFSGQGRWTEFSLVTALYLGFAFHVMALLLFWRILVLTVGRNDGTLVRPLVVMASPLLFWTAPAEAWLWPSASLAFLPVTFWAVATVWALLEWPASWRGLFVSSACAAFGGFTSASGLPPLAILIGARRRRQASPF
jgi:hypothetical protein